MYQNGVQTEWSRWEQYQLFANIYVLSWNPLHAHTSITTIQQNKHHIRVHRLGIVHTHMIQWVEDGNSLQIFSGSHGRHFEASAINSSNTDVSIESYFGAFGEPINRFCPGYSAEMFCTDVRRLSSGRHSKMPSIIGRNVKADVCYRQSGSRGRLWYQLCQFWGVLETFSR